MLIDRANGVALHATLSQDISALRRLSGGLLRYDPNNLGGDALNSAAYQLHNIYNALENAFSQIARAFLGQAQDPSAWHRDLANLMFLDMASSRPAVLPAEVRHIVDNLRGFRHVFRHAYDFELDAGRVGIVLAEWNGQSEKMIAALEGFAQKVAFAVNEPGAPEGQP